MEYLLIFGPLAVLFVLVLLFATERQTGWWSRRKTDRAWRRLSEEQQAAALFELFEADKSPPGRRGARPQDGRQIPLPR